MSPINTDRELIDYLLYNFSETQKNKVFCLMVSKNVRFNAVNVRACAQFLLERIDEQQLANGLE